MFKTIYLGKLYGTKIYIHWSFWILAILVFLMQLPSGLERAMSMLGFVFAVFGCVFLHELGHALAARSFGRSTLDITLLPIGGVARIQGGDLDPWPDGWIAAAGPAVNFAIAFLIWVSASLVFAFRLGLGWDDASMFDFNMLPEWTWAKQLLFANLVLAVFNLIPAFPLDGGRIFRSLLCAVVDRSRAIDISSRVGQWIAAIWILYSLIRLDFLGVVFGIVIYGINAAQRLQSQWIVVSRGGGSGSDSTPYSPGPWGAANQGDTIDAVEVRHVEPRDSKSRLDPSAGDDTGRNPYLP